MLEIMESTYIVHTYDSPRQKRPRMLTIASSKTDKDAFAAGQTPTSEEKEESASSAVHAPLAVAAFVFSD